MGQTAWGAMAAIDEPTMRDSEADAGAATRAATGDPAAVTPPSRSSPLVSPTRRSRVSPLPVLALLLALVLAPLAPAAAQPTPIDLQLNKLEAIEGGCRAFFVVRNGSDVAFDSLDLDLVTFQPDGVIGARFQVELAPLAADKTVVKPFDFAGVGCEAIDRVLLNGVVACGPPTPTACLERLAPSSLGVDFFR